MEKRKKEVDYNKKYIQQNGKNKFSIEQHNKNEKKSKTFMLFCLIFIF